MAKRKIRRNPASRKMLSSEQVSEVARLVTAVAEVERTNLALAGGAAMHFYGSDRLTADVDFVARRPLKGLGEPLGSLAIGGGQYVVDGVEVDLIVRDDAYVKLYREALARSVDSGEGYEVISPEYLLAMKMVARGGKHEGDALFLLTNLYVDLDGVRDIVRRLVGGQFAVDELESLIAEAEWQKSRGD